VHYPQAVLNFIKLKKNFKPDLVYTNSYRQIVLLYPFFKKNIVYHVHDPNSYSSLSRFFLRLIDKKILRYIAVSHFIKNDLIKSDLDSKKIEVIHNGVNVPNKDQKQYMPQGILRIGIVGQIIPRKGHEDLLNAFSLLAEKIEFEVNIFGNGAEDFIKKMITYIQVNSLEEKVCWRGFVSNLKEIYSVIDVLVAPTKSDEPFALVVLEASSYCIPTIATKSGGFPESIIDGTTGFIVNKDSPDEIAKKLEYLYKNPSMIAEMGAAAYERISSNFALNKMINTTVQLVENLNTNGNIL